MKWFERFITYLFPTLLIDGTPWKETWEKQQNESFVLVCKIAFPIVTVGYIANFYLFDVPMGLEPRDFWFKFRLAMATLFFLTFLFYMSPWANSKYYRFPAYLSSFALCYSQAWVTVWYGKEAWVFFFLFILTSALVLRLTAFQSFVYASIVILFSVDVLLEGGLSIANLTTGSIVAIVATVTIRATALTDVQLFLSNQRHEAAQSKLIEVSEEYAERIKSFIPRVIANRLSDLMEKKRLNVVEASIEALKARKKVISCLFTDIRGFTQGSKDLDGFIGESVLPEVSACSEVIEDLHGIPRKVGDLIFAYFDDDQINRNVLRALLSGVEIARINASMNATSSQTEIRRYILVSTGIAYVGNFGGLDSSIEITALGSPVNFLSRLDDLTKAPALAKILEQGDVILDATTASKIAEIGLDISIETISLEELKLEIRDFPEVRAIYRLKPSDVAFDQLIQSLDGVEEI